MAENILFIFEGEKTEYKITDTLLSYFIQEKEKTVVRSAYKTNIYSLYHRMKKDDFLDIFELVKDGCDELSKFNRGDFSQVYLFFDYDGHDPNTTEEKISEMIVFFNEETENGKLFISYPMVESVKCIDNLSSCNNFYTLEYIVADSKSYKGFVDSYCDNSLKDYRYYTEDMWKSIIKIHGVKGNIIVNGVMENPSSIIEQSALFDKQCVDFLRPKKAVSVIGAFPLMVFEYYGIENAFKRL